MLPTRVSSEGWYHLLQKLTGRSVNPGLQMFGQSISGNVDMDGNGYAGPVTAQMEILLLGYLVLLQQWCSTLVMEAFCWQHSRADAQTLAPDLCEVFYICIVPASRHCSSIPSSMWCVFWFQMSLSGLSWRTAWCCWGESVCWFIFSHLRPVFWFFDIESFPTVCSRTRPVVTVDVSIFLPISINITVPQCHEGLPNTNCFNVSVCMRFRGRQLPGLIGEATSSEQSSSIFCYCDLSIHELTQHQANSNALELLELFKSTSMLCNHPVFLLRITVVLMPCDRKARPLISTTYLQLQ